jgi:hypothetical protein
LPPHLVVQALVVGAAALLLLPGLVPERAAAPLAWLLAIAAATHVAMVAGEVLLTHGTAHARLAIEAMTSGRYRGVFWLGLALALVAMAAPWLPIAPPVAALAGVLAFEHAHVQAGQAVPLA